MTGRVQVYTVGELQFRVPGDPREQERHHGDVELARGVRFFGGLAALAGLFILFVTVVAVSSVLRRRPLEILRRFSE